MKEIKAFSGPDCKFYTGFIYIWKNKNSSKFYIGSHMGNVNDGYVGSGIHFKNAYKKYKESFRRKILQYVWGDICDLQRAEENWLKLMPPSEMKGVKYYNRSRICTGLHPMTKESIEKMANGHRGKTLSNDHKEAISKANKGNKHRLGIPTSQLQKDTVSKLHTGKIVSQSVRESISKTLTGVPHDLDRVEKMRATKLASNRKWYTNGKHSSLFPEGEQPDGYVIGRKRR